MVVGDAAEGYNPIHDAFRLTLNAAVELARRETGRAIANYDFALFGPPGPRGGGDALRVALGDRERDAKRREAAAYVQLEREVEWSLKQYGDRAFDYEWLRPVHEEAGDYPLDATPPIYERYGDHLKSQGELTRVIRHKDHLEPLAQALGELARA